MMICIVSRRKANEFETEDCNAFSYTSTNLMPYSLLLCGLRILCTSSGFQLGDIDRDEFQKKDYFSCQSVSRSMNEKTSCHCQSVLFCTVCDRGMAKSFIYVYPPVCLNKRKNIFALCSAPRKQANCNAKNNNVSSDQCSAPNISLQAFLRYSFFNFPRFLTQQYLNVVPRHVYKSFIFWIKNLS